MLGTGPRAEARTTPCCSTNFGQRAAAGFVGFRFAAAARVGFAAVRFAGFAAARFAGRPALGFAAARFGFGFAARFGFGFGVAARFAGSGRFLAVGAAFFTAGSRR
jgi:hypothetical protein